MTIEIVKYELPTYWASALINGDLSGLEADDLIGLAQFENYMMKEHGSCHAADVESEGHFSRWHDATRFGILACDVAEYSFFVEGGE